MQNHSENNDPLNPYRADPFETHRDRFGTSPEHEVARFDSNDGRWGWVRLGLLSLLFGYFCIPVFIVSAGVVSRMQDAELMHSVTIVGVGASLMPIAFGWLLCGMTPEEAGTRRYALIVAIAMAAQIWMAMAKLWPDVVEVLPLITRFKSLISIVAISCMLRYLQGTFEYLRPGHQDTWARKLAKLTSWCTIGLIAGVFVIMTIGMPPQAFLIPILVVVFFAFLAMMILFWGCLFRLWFLLRGEGQFAGSEEAW